MTDKMKVIPKMDYDVLTVEAAKKVASNPEIKELAAHIAEIATILDQMNYNAGTGWEDQAVIAVMAMTRAAVWKAKGMPPMVKKEDPVPANDNKPDDMKMAA